MVNVIVKIAKGIFLVSVGVSFFYGIYDTFDVYCPNKVFKIFFLLVELILGFYFIWKGISYFSF